MTLKSGSISPANDSATSQTYEIISSVALRDLTVTVDSPATAFAALVTNNRTDVVYKNPFGFSLQAIQAGGAFTMYVSCALVTVEQATDPFRTATTTMLTRRS